MKYCRYCDQHLTLDHFTKRVASPDGLGHKCRACAKAYYDKRYAENADVRAAAMARATKWATNNREKRRQIVTAYDDRNRDEKKKKGKANYQKLMLEKPELMRAKAVLAAQRRRHRAVENKSFPHPGVFQRLMERAGGICTYCENKFDKLSLDHFHPVSKGGDGTVSNLIPCCKHCNSSKKDKDGPSWIEKKFGIDRLVSVVWRIEYLSAARLP